MTAGLSKDDPHYWHPVPEVIDWLCNRLPDGARVLEIGPGTVPFARADVFVDFVDVDTVPKHKLIKCDVANDPLPFPDKSFDFVVCRHTLEDMWNPFPICAEMSRVAKAGYVETPSPLAELCRGVDGSAPPYRGYHHHRFVVWNDGEELKFVSKYPLVEHMELDEAKLADVLKSGPRYWNTYYLWSGEIKVKHVQSPLDFDIPRQYPIVLNDAMNQSMAATDKFAQNLAKPRSLHGA